MATPQFPSTKTLVDYLNTKGQNSSFNARAKMFRDAGLDKRLGSYKGTTSQNVTLLKQLQGSTFGPSSGAATTPRSGSAFTPRSVAAQTPASGSSVRGTAQRFLGRAANSIANNPATRFLANNPAMTGATIFGVPAAVDAYNAATGQETQQFEGADTATANSSAQMRTVTPRGQMPSTPTQRGYDPNAPATQTQMTAGDRADMESMFRATEIANMFPDYMSPTARYTGDVGGGQTAAQGGAQTGTQGDTAATSDDTARVNTIDTKLGQINQEIAQFTRFGMQVPKELQQQKLNILGEEVRSLNDMVMNMGGEGVDMSGLSYVDNKIQSETGISGTTVAGEDAGAPEVGLINEWLTSPEGQLALEQAELDNLTAQQKNEVAKQALETKYASEKEALLNNLAAKGLSFSGIRASQVKALADALAASKLNADREFASKLLDADISFRRTVLDGVADLIEAAENDNKQAIDQLNKAGYAVVNGELIPTLSMLKEQRVADTPELYITTNSAGQVSAFDKNTGEMLWRTEGGVGRSGSASPNLRVTPITDPVTGTVSAIQVIGDDGTWNYLDPNTSEQLDPSQVVAGEPMSAEDQLINSILSEIELGAPPTQ